MVRFSWCACCVAAALASAPAEAQRLLALEARTGAGPDALAEGPIATFWNPALATPPLGARFDGFIMDVRAPESTGLGGLVLGATVQLDDRTAAGLGYLHAEVEGIRRTTTSPLPEDDLGEIDVSEDVFALSLARELGEHARAGAAVRYGRAADVAGGDAVVDLAAGAIVTPALPWQPRLGGAIEVEDDGVDWSAGVGVEPPIALTDWSFALRYGAAGSHRMHGLTHRVGAAAAWDGGVGVEAGLAIEPGAGGHTVEPVLGASFAFQRYRVGVLRESLANGLGEVYSFRFGVTFP